MANKENWQKYRIKDITTSFSGGTPLTNHPEFYESGCVPFITSSDLNESPIKQIPHTITQKGLESSSAKIVKKNTLLFALYGATAGACAITQKSGAINQAVLALVNCKINEKLLYYVLSWKKDYILHTYTQGGQPNLSAQIVNNLSFFLPTDKQEQNLIVAVLETWDKAIGLTKQLLEQKKLQKKYLMQQLLTGRIRLKGFTGKWEIYSLSQIVTPINCLVGNKQLVALSISAKVGFVPQKEKFGRDISGEQYTKYTLLKYGNFAYNKGNSYTYPQGCVYRLENYKEAAVPNVFECFSANEQKVSPLYLKQYFKANLHSKQLLRLINSGVRNNGLLNLSSTDFYSIKLELPSLREQNKITDILSSCDREIDLLKQKLAKLEEQKKGLMQVLLPGKVRMI